MHFTWNFLGIRVVCPIVLAWLVSACSLSDLVDTGTPESDRVDEDIVHSYDGAVGLYQGAVSQFTTMVPTYIQMSGLFTDELKNTRTSPPDHLYADARFGADSAAMLTRVFTDLSIVRAQAQQALGALGRYSTRTPKAYVGELYAILGMSELLMTELFCSGIPLATTPFGEDPTYSGAFSRTEIETLAIAHFDSALIFGGDSLPVATLARVGKGRTLLNAGNYTAAATAVADVATSDTYVLQYGSTFPLFNTLAYYTTQYQHSVAPGEGMNGLMWPTTTPDPRVPLTQSGSNWRQAKYTTTSPIIAASGIEARLIEAEAKLQAKDYTGWIGILQALATTGPAGTPVPVDPGAVAGNDSARVSLQFRERALWLFLTGHRQGDLRRLIRQYGRAVGTTYPMGIYTPTNASAPVYGQHVTVAPPLTERQQNEKYDGCLDRNA